MTQQRVLIIDDEKNMRHMLKTMLVSEFRWFADEDNAF